MCTQKLLLAIGKGGLPANQDFISENTDNLVGGLEYVAHKVVYADWIERFEINGITPGHYSLKRGEGLGLTIEEDLIVFSITLISNGALPLEELTELLDNLLRECALFFNSTFSLAEVAHLNIRKVYHNNRILN